ncbi:MAG: SCO6745 family protein [Marmoricola sp.]
MTPERELWSLYEPAHVIVYFDADVSGCLAEHGLHGFWNGYFAGRAAPMGAVGPVPVTATFLGFAPAMVAKAVPKVWGRITPEQAVAARLDAVDAMLGPLLAAGSADDVRRVSDLLVRAASELSCDGRALAAAWQGVDPGDRLAVRLWWAATVLREHRGDGHVLAATYAGLDGLETTLTHIASGVVTRETMQRNRGWTDEQWDAATTSLHERGILAADGSLTEAGVALRQQIEADTDRLAHAPYAALADDLALVRPVLYDLGDQLIAHGSLPAGNPMGLTR